ncbi:Protein kinase, ATP binding site-containing protein [Cynara cardunculus var. scolymus]|uniref:Protein kinase, ATP binding site-containing protein n=1 Tax=Cynara cardunculus var. scolymus TaxID=59895 RepID=A0A103XHF5_CYNCS|nr:Protein kinase, ATP binding site-containing protein [Cynara cardunculus var. scolymus]
MGMCSGKPANVAHVSSSQFMEDVGNRNRRNNSHPAKDRSGMAIFKKVSKASGDESFAIPINLKAFTLNELKAATKNFRPDSLLGEGGFGQVFKGWIDETTFAPVRPGTGLVVAVKVLKSESHQGHKEWLVKGVEPMAWATRMSIAIDVAHGLSFLHSKEPSIIYRDLKASNILLDSEFTARLSDFGLARNGPVGDNTHVSTRVVGTSGYAAPEYVATGHLTRKNDVYSFGVVLLELLSGRRAIADERAGGVEETLVEWVKPFLIDKRGVFRIMDTRLGGRYSKKGAQAVAELALKCLNNDPKHRPAMTEVVESLEQITNTPKNVPQISS